MRKRTAALLLAIAITLSALFGSGTLKDAEAPEDEPPTSPISPVAYDDSAEIAELKQRKQAHMSDLARARAEEAERQRHIAIEVRRKQALIVAEDKRKRALLAQKVVSKPKATPSRSQGYVGKAREFTATAYTAYCEGCSGITKTGVNLRQSIYHEGKRVIAVDPRYIPLGSIVRVTLADGSSFEAIAEDVGGAIKGAIIDVAHANKSEMIAFGRQSVDVRIIRKGR